MGIIPVVLLVVVAVASGSGSACEEPVRADFCAVIQQPERFAGKMVEVRALQTKLKSEWGLLGDCWPPVLLVFPKDLSPRPNFTLEESDNPTGQNIQVTFDPSKLSAGLVGHEGQHVADASAWIASGYASALNPTAYQGEFDAIRVQLLILEGQGNIGVFLESGSERRLMWFQGWPESNVTNAINGYLAIPRTAGGLYELTPRNPRRLFTRPVSPRR